MNLRQLFFVISLLVLHKGVSQQMPDTLQKTLKSLPSHHARFDHLMTLGTKHVKNDLEWSLQLLHWGLEEAHTAAIDTLKARAFKNIGTNYLFRGDLDRAMEYNYKALEIYEGYPEHEGRFKTLNSIGLIHLGRQKYDLALKNFFKADTLASQIFKGDTLRLYKVKGTIYNNIGIIYNKLDEQDHALETYIKASNYCKLVNDSINLANNYSNIGLTYIHLESYNMAESYLKEALQLRNSLNDTYGICKSSLHLGTLYHLNDQAELALPYLQSGLELSEKLNSAYLRSEVLKVLGEVMMGKGLFKEALSHHLEFQSIKDSLYNSDTEARITRMEMQHKFDREKHKAMARQQKKDLITIIAVIVLIASTLLFIFMYRLQRSRTVNQRLAFEKADLENKELELRKQRLEEQLEVRSKQLTSNVMYLLKKNELISDISLKLIDFKKELSQDKKKSLHRIIFELQQGQDDEIWDEFEVRFNEVYTDFYERLNARFPDLTPNQKKLCAFLRLNLTSKEICALTRQSLNTLNVARTRLRKKLNLDNTEINLVNFLEQI